MLSLPDFSAKQIIFLESQDAKDLLFENDNILLKEDGVRVNQIPCIKIFALFIWGKCTLTSVLIRKLLSYGIVIFLLKRNFQPYAVIGGETEGNTLLRKKQYNCLHSFEIAQKIVHSKLFNQSEILKKSRMDLPGSVHVSTTLDTFCSKIPESKTIAELMGIEGVAAKSFFSCYFLSLGWHGRKPRTKYDIPNLFLDMGYTFLFHFIDAQLRLYGFDTYVGNLHQEFYQRKSLVCDVIEPCRCIIDKALLKAFHLKQINEKDFSVHQEQYVLKYEHARKYASIFLKAIMEQKEPIFKYIQNYYRCIMKDSLDIEFFKI